MCLIVMDWKLVEAMAVFDLVMDWKSVEERLCLI